MPEDGIPPWVSHLTREMREFRTEINARFDTFASGYVSVGVHQALVDRVADLEGDLKTEKGERERDVTTLKTELNEARKRTAQLWTSIGLLVAGGVVGTLFMIFNRGLGLG
jgi:hypothetical protein